MKNITFALSVVAPYLILILGFFTYFSGYENPPALFWDENYYLTATEKYKKNIFFEESHPPLGKLVMYAGERLWDPNPGVTVDFEKTDFARNIPNGYSFKGVRFFPAFFGWINCVMIFVLLLTVTGSSAWALSLSLLYVMDNALIVHSRGAMLDSIQIFGILLSLIAYFRAFQDGRFSKRWLATLAIGIAWATWTKLNGLIVGALAPMLLFYPFEDTWKEKIKAILPSWGLMAGVFFVFSVFVWQIHFSKSQHIEPALNNNGWYRASEELKDIKLHPENHNNPITNFYYEFASYMTYSLHYSDGVPTLDLCKKGENGSPFYWWPFGARTINYRWETKNGGEWTSYLYLVPNPVVWGLALLAVILSFAYFIMKFVFKNVQMAKEDEQQLLVVFLLYLAYMITMARINRVMYTYHYFIPLIFSFVMVAKWVPHIVNRIQIKNFPYKEVFSQIIIMLGITCAWVYYSPFTYYNPLSCSEFESRILFNGWQMKPIQCREFKDESYYRIITPPAAPQVQVVSSPVSQVPIPPKGLPANFKNVKYQQKPKK